MGDEARVLVHDVRPERNDLFPVVLGLQTPERLEPPLPTLRLVPGVVEEQWPHEAAQLPRRLRLAEPRLVLDERLDRLGDVADEGGQRGATRRCTGVDLVIQPGECVLEAERLLTLLC